MSKIIQLRYGCGYCKVSALYTLDDRDFTWCNNEDCEAYAYIDTQ